MKSWKKWLMWIVLRLGGAIFATTILGFAKKIPIVGGLIDSLKGSANKGSQTNTDTKG